MVLLFLGFSFDNQAAEMHIRTRDVVGMVAIITAVNAAILGGISYGAYKAYRYAKPLPEDQVDAVDQFVGSCKPTVQGLKNAGKESVEYGKIMATCVVAASLYGIAQDQVTYRFCPEYFTKGFHKPMMDKYKNDGPVMSAIKNVYHDNPDNPTLRATIWGTLASWWMGAIIGVPVTLACRVGSWPKMNYKDIIKPLACTMGLTGASTAFAGLQAWVLVAGTDLSWSKYWLQTKGVNFDGAADTNGFFVDANAHTAAYATGPLWSIGLILHILKTRYNLSKQLEQSVEQP